jgi:RNA polymerase sigma-70 factor (ECF subfamily)
MMAVAMPAFPGKDPPPVPPDAPRASAELDRPTLERARSRDPMALRAFVVRYERPVFALLSRMLGQGPHVEDLAQETFLRAFRALPAFEPDGRARASTWLLTIATRLALDARKKKKLPLAEPEATDGVPDGSTPEKEASRRELGRHLAQAAEALSDDMRAAFLLAELHGFTMAEVAEALGIPENTAKTRVFRAKQHMRDALADLREGAPADPRDRRDLEKPGTKEEV